MNVKWRKGLVVAVSLLCFILLLCAIAGNDWVHSESHHTTIGLWRVCRRHRHHGTICINEVYFSDEWFQGVRALLTISTLLGGLAVLFSIPTFVLEEDHKLHKLSHPYLIAGMLLIAGEFVIDFVNIFQCRQFSFAYILS